MMRKNKSASKTEETSLAQPTGDSLLAWFDETDRWFDDVRRGIEERFWGPLARWGESGLRIRQPLVDLIDEGSAFVVRAEMPGVAKQDIDLKVTPRGIEIRAETDRSREVVPAGSQGGPGGGDDEGRRLGSPHPQEGANPGAEARQGAGRVNPHSFPFLRTRPRGRPLHEFK